MESDGIGTVGTFAWATATRGILREEDGLALKRQLVALGQRFAAPRSPAARADVGIEDVRLPDSALVRDAEALCREVSASWLYGHCVRTYHWGAALGLRDGIAFDAEILAVASLLHDLGIVERYAGYGGHECFAACGAQAARDLVLKRDSRTDVAEAIAETISFHLNVDVPLIEGPEAHLLSAGVGLDIYGGRLDDLPRALALDVLARFPREDTAAQIAAVIDDQADRHPGTRSEFLHDEVRLHELAKHCALDTMSG
jgi:hypothetical protein